MPAQRKAPRRTEALCLCQTCGRRRQYREVCLHRERAAAAARALGAGVRDTEAAAVEVVVEVHGDIVQVHEATLVDNDGDAVELEDFVQLGINRRVEVQLVLETAAAAADHAHAQVDFFRQPLLFAQDASDFRGSLFGYGDGHQLSS